MILCRVEGQVVATIKHPSYANRRLLLLDRIKPDGEATGDYLVAIDSVDATVGQNVLVIDEGGSARQIIGDSEACIRSIIIGIVDDVQLSG